jgi:hypothetical protein
MYPMTRSPMLQTWLSPVLRSQQKALALVGHHPMQVVSGQKYARLSHSIAAVDLAGCVRQRFATACRQSLPPGEGEGQDGGRGMTGCTFCRCKTVTHTPLLDVA